MESNKPKKVVTLGGGTGNFTVLQGIKIYPLEISAIVSMADSGGSTGVLRDELGVLPPGDIRQCIVALSEESEIVRKWFNQRMEDKGSLEGHTVGNIMISTLEKVTGSMAEALVVLHKLMKLQGSILPVTFEHVTLMAKTSQGEVITGEHLIDKSQNNYKIDSVFFDPMPTANPMAISALLEADLIVIAPGDLYTSILPILIIPEIAVALRKTKAKVAMVAPLMTKFGHTDGFSVYDYVSHYEDVVGQKFITAAIYNTGVPEAELLSKYAQEGGMVEFKGGHFLDRPEVTLVGADLLLPQIVQQSKSDQVKRSLIRHNSLKLASLLFDLL